MPTQEEIKEVFDLAGIDETEYPEYDDPESLARTFEKFTLLKTLPIMESNSTVTD